MIARSHEPISQALAALLEERGMSQAELCRATGLNHCTASRYLSGNRGRTIDLRAARTLEKIASALGVEPDYFLEYRSWRVRQVALSDPDLVDDLYDLMVEVLRLRTLPQSLADKAEQ